MTTADQIIAYIRRVLGLTKNTDDVIAPMLKVARGLESVVKANAETVKANAARMQQLSLVNDTLNNDSNRAAQVRRSIAHIVGV